MSFSLPLGNVFRSDFPLILGEKGQFYVHPQFEAQAFYEEIRLSIGLSGSRSRDPGDGYPITYAYSYSKEVTLTRIRRDALTLIDPATEIAEMSLFTPTLPSQVTSGTSGDCLMRMAPTYMSNGAFLLHDPRQPGLHIYQSPSFSNETIGTRSSTEFGVADSDLKSDIDLPVPEFGSSDGFSATAGEGYHYDWWGCRIADFIPNQLSSMTTDVDMGEDVSAWGVSDWRDLRRIVALTITDDNPGSYWDSTSVEVAFEWEIS